MSSAPPPFTLDDLLSWIEDAHAQLLLGDPDVNFGRGFAHQFMADLTRSVPEVSLYTARAHLECQRADGSWHSLALTQRQFIIPQFEGQWLFHGGVASDANINEMMERLMKHVSGALTNNGDDPDLVNHIRVSFIEFDPDPSAYDLLQSMSSSKMALDILGGHRARHLQAHVLENQTPAAIGRGSPKRI